MHRRLSAFLIALLIGLGAFAPQAFAEKQPAYCSSYKDNRCRKSCESYVPTANSMWHPGCHDNCTKMYKKCGYKESTEEQSRALRNEKENLQRREKDLRKKVEEKKALERKETLEKKEAPEKDGTPMVRRNSRSRI